VLAEVDVHARDGWQDGLEDATRPGVVACEEGLCRSREVLGHIGRVGFADATGGFGECLRVRDDPWRWARTAGPVLGRSREQPVDDRGSNPLVEVFEGGAHGNPQLRRAQRIERLVDLGVFYRQRPSMSPDACCHVTSLRPAGWPMAYQR
jgi:hypothetical protein